MSKAQDYSPRTTALAHQVEAIDFISTREWSALFDEQGLGKTKIVIDALARMMAKDEIDACLVVAPLTLLFNWEDEVRKHSHLVPVVIRGSRHKRKYQLLTGANFYIANYEALVGGSEIFTKLLKSRRMALALDEAARIKDPDTLVTQTLHRMRSFAKRRIILTGTAVANHPIDLWAQFFFLDGGKLLGASFRSFAAQFDERSPDYLDALRQLSEQIAEHSIRRLKSEVLSLPGKSFVADHVNLAGPQADIYRRCADDLLVELEALTGEQYLKQLDNILEKLLRLVQIASNPGLLDSTYRGPNAKFEYLDQLVPQLLGVHPKLIIWSSFVSNVEALAERYHQYGTGVIHGGTPIEARADLVRRFQSVDRPRILVANPGAAREGITLTRASAAVYVDRTFSLVDYLQSQDRIHRIGQGRDCFIHKLIAADTVDEYVDVIIELKSAVADYVYRPTSPGGLQIGSLLQDKNVLVSLL